jgi:Cytochrome C assembly protein.
LVAFVGFLATLFALPSSPSPYKSTLYGLHLLFASLSYLFALMGGLSAFLRLILEKRLKKHVFFQAYVPLDSLRRAERLSINLAFLGFTFTLIFGSLWTRTQFGKHWIDDPKLITTLLLWLYYALLSHLNLLKKLKPKRFSEGVILGAIFSLINLFFVRHNF